ncbi:uncharacterized protein LOC143660983 [Tamandua tetradactyla]|uniref:uncharacterized protein LOC143660983 n=1 Tax=Tamandua tetradactyla TaxID=48850 RepID=UPI004053A1B7
MAPPDPGRSLSPPPGLCFRKWARDSRRRKQKGDYGRIRWTRRGPALPSSQPPEVDDRPARTSAQLVSRRPTVTHAQPDPRSGVGPGPPTRAKENRGPLAKIVMSNPRCLTWAFTLHSCEYLSPVGKPKGRAKGKISARSGETGFCALLLAALGLAEDSQLPLTFLRTSGLSCL